MTIILVNPGIPLAVVLDPQHLPTRSHRPIAILNHFKLWWDHSKKVQISMENKDVPPHFAEGAWFFFNIFRSYIKVVTSQFSEFTDVYSTSTKTRSRVQYHITLW